MSDREIGGGVIDWMLVRMYVSSCCAAKMLRLEVGPRAGREREKGGWEFRCTDACKQGNSRKTYEDNRGGVQESTRHFFLFQISYFWQHVKERTPQDI